jgi:hypothetical protein
VSTMSQSVNDRRAELRSQIAEPAFTEGMTREQRRAEMDRYLADCQVQMERLDEEHRLLGIGRSAAVYMSREITWDWQNATAGRWYQALPERYMTPDSLHRPDWDHSHYQHDENGHMDRHVTTLQRPETEADTRAAALIARILADAAGKES